MPKAGRRFPGKHHESVNNAAPECKEEAEGEELPSATTDK